MSGVKFVDVSEIEPSRTSPSPESYMSVGTQMVESFRSTGLVYLTNHGIPRLMEQETYSTGRQFFRLPADVKARNERFEKVGANGYTSLSGEKPFYYGDLADYKECYDIRDLDEDIPDDVLPSFTGQLKRLGSSCRFLAVRLIQALDVALEAGGRLMALHQKMLTRQGCTELRMIYYPPVPEDIAVNTVRCAAHTDYGTLTYLFQDDIGGLERKTSSGEYVPIVAVEDALALITGDMLELFTSGRVQAAKHRVVIPQKEVLRRTFRQSIVFFVHPDDEALVEPLDGDAGFQSTTGGRLLQDRFNVIYPNTFAQWDKKRDSKNNSATLSLETIPSGSIELPTFSL